MPHRRHSVVSPVAASSHWKEWVMARSVRPVRTKSDISTDVVINANIQLHIVANIKDVRKMEKCNTSAKVIQLYIPDKDGKEMDGGRRQLLCRLDAKPYDGTHSQSRQKCDRLAMQYLRP